MFGRKKAMITDRAQLLHPYATSRNLSGTRNSLVVPDPLALAAYVESMLGLPDVSQQELADLRRVLASRIWDGGPMRIHKDAGVLVATGPRSPGRNPAPAAS